MSDTAARVSEELRLPQAGVRAVLALIDGGATVPFIARYRKEQTGGLDEVQIRAVADARTRIDALEERRATVLSTIREQGKLTAELRKAIEACRTRAELEDLYLPYRPKRRTRAQAARERGLEPLALRILAQPRDGDPRREKDEDLAGARDIVAEIFSERVDVRALVRQRFEREGLVESTAVKDKTKAPTKFEAYYAFSERAKTIPSHRYLALERGEAEGVLRVRVRVDEDALVRELQGRGGVKRGTPFARELEEAIADAMKRLLLPSIESDVRAELKQRSDVAAVQVFAENVSKLLLAPPSAGTWCSVSIRGSAPAASASSSTTRGGCWRTR